jgi:hypothetical protein
MLGKVLKGAAYVKAPRKTFAMLHPWKALKYGALFWIGKKIFSSGKNRETAPRSKV